MFPVTGIILGSPPLSKRYHSSCSTCLQILICTTSSAVTKQEPEERNGRECAKGQSSLHTKTVPKKKRWREVWWIFNFGEKSNSIGEMGPLRSCSPASCQESGSNLQSEDKTSFSLWLNHWWIILLFRQVLLACGEVKSVFLISLGKMMTIGLFMMFSFLLHDKSVLVFFMS